MASSSSWDSFIPDSNPVYPGAPYPLFFVRLGEPERSIMLLRLSGRTLLEAAYLLGHSRKRADTAYQRGLRQLERLLRDYRPPSKI